MKEQVVNDNLQHDYRYVCTEAVGKNFDPEFKPHLSPQEMLELGVFDGIYFSEIPKEFPKKWFKNAKLSPDGKPHKELNLYKVHASQSREEWERKGWIHKDDPRGWFQWYCRYFMGRRHEDDQRQIKRWKAITRHASQIKHNCRANDQQCRPRQRQAILHWAYDPQNL